MRKKIAVSIAALTAGLLLAGTASAAVTVAGGNGGFSTNGGSGQIGFDTTASGWTVAGPPGSYDFLFNTSNVTTGVAGEYGNLALWGPVAASPDGGEFLGADPQFQNSTLNTTIAGLTSGTQYSLTFDWAGAQQVGFTGDTTAGWNVSINGAAAVSTGLITTPSHPSTPWQTATMTFVATGPTETLSFLAIGGPSQSLPPFALLDGVNVEVVPEPTTWALMIMGFGGVGAMVRNRRRQVALTA